MTFFPTGRYRTREEIIAAVKRTYAVDLTDLLDATAAERFTGAEIQAAHTAYEIAKNLMLVNDGIARHADAAAEQFRHIGQVARHEHLDEVAELVEITSLDKWQPAVTAATTAATKIACWISQSAALSETLYRTLLILMPSNRPERTP